MGDVGAVGLLVCAQGDWSEVVWGGYLLFGVVYMWFGDNGAGRRIKTILNLFFKY